MFETKHVGHASAGLPAAEPAPPCFPPKETVPVVMDIPGAAELAVEPVQNREEDVDSAGSTQPSTSTTTARSGTTQPSAKPPRSRREAAFAAPAAGSGAAAAGGPANQGAEAAGGAAGGESVGEDDYQAYYLSAASEEGADRQLADNHQEEEPDIFAGMKPLEQEGRMEVRKEDQMLCWFIVQNFAADLYRNGLKIDKTCTLLMSLSIKYPIPIFLTRIIQLHAIWSEL